MTHQPEPILAWHFVGHTPGPWEIEHAVTTLSGATRVLITANAGAVDVATVHLIWEPPHARDSNAALIAAAPELYAFWLANQWQPIETAPKDGTTIILLIMGAVIEGSWCKILEKWEVLRLPSHGCECCSDNNPNPTHWRPRFIPPKE